MYVFLEQRSLLLLLKYNKLQYWVAFFEVSTINVFLVFDLRDR
jgi:hypothetical protein